VICRYVLRQLALRHSGAIAPRSFLLQRSYQQPLLAMQQLYPSHLMVLERQQQLLWGQLLLRPMSPSVSLATDVSGYHADTTSLPDLHGSPPVPNFLLVKMKLMVMMQMVRFAAEVGMYD
jgi:hypothetical protein